MKKGLLCLICLNLLIMQHLNAAIKFDLGDYSILKVGGRLQVETRAQKNALNSSNPVWVKDTLSRRARLQIGYAYQDHFEAFMQTDLGDNNPGRDMRIIDAWVAFHLDKMANIYAGLQMPPASRQCLTSSAALLAIDRPSLTYKNLSWGNTGQAAINSISFNSAGINAPVAIRDEGITIFGADSYSSELHYKYYVGMYDGGKVASYSETGERYILRGQINILDPEPGYYNAAHYLGSKNTIAFGISTDKQINVTDASGSVYKTNYDYSEIDVFLELLLGKDSLTIESAYSILDLGSVKPLAEGKGLYCQLGYYLNSWKIQPWLLYEKWEALNAAGDYTNIRLGATYFLKGKSINIKIGGEQFTPQAGSKIYTAMVGVYTDF
jgi:hypothetical protein